ncbi:hypothetical protein M1578_02390 [Candidatus Marsarchaeota archaeon]|nr:hypothetical protein [Candidatus Marsarchaeota archaeon]
MKTYILLAMIAVFATAQLGLAGAASCNTADVGFKVIGVSWGASNSTRINNATQIHISAGPNERDVPLTLSIQSYGTSSNTCSLTAVEGQLQVYGGFSNFNGSAEYPTAYVQQVYPSSIFNMEFNLNIANVIAGPNITYIFPLYLYYNYSNYTLRNSQTINIGIPMHGSANLIYTPSVKALGPGIDNVTLRVSNTGSGALANISTSISSQSGISVLEQPQGISYLAPGQSRNVTVLLYNPSSSGGSAASLEVNSHFISPYGYNTTASSAINLYTIQVPRLITLYPSNQTLVAGKPNYMRMYIHNGGSSPIYNMSVLLTPQSPLDIFGNNSYVVLPLIPANSSASFPIELYAQASSSSQVNTLDAALTYTANGQTQTANKAVTFLAPGYVNLSQVSLSVLPAAPTTGTIFTITATVDNLGSIPATAASVVAETPGGIRVVGQNTTFVGSIPVDTPTAFSLSFIATKAGKYTIPVKVEYLNNLNQHLNTSFDYQVTVGSGNYSGFNGSSSPASKYIAGYRRGNSDALYIEVAVAFIGVIAIAVSAYYLRIRKRGTKRHSR